MNTTSKAALKLIPEPLKTQSAFLSADDTMISKFGTKFENVTKLFGYGAHNGFGSMSLLPIKGMSGKSTIEPGWQWLDKLYFNAPILIFLNTEQKVYRSFVLN